MAALDLPYEHYVEINGGEFCGICGDPPKPGRRLCRDHAHEGNGTPRGLLCVKCNRFLVKQRYGLKVTADWLRRAAAYHERTEV